MGYRSIHKISKFVGFGCCGIGGILVLTYMPIWCWFFTVGVIFIGLGIFICKMR